MKVILAGYNVEAGQLPAVPGDLPLTPEVFSAAYARISRSARGIEALRRQARIDIRQARRSNRNIIFDMGHHSVAEHAVFNFDIIGISRLALEELERFRLVSFTEKSQRYVTLKGDFYLPESLPSDTLRRQYLDTIEQQNLFYRKSYRVLKEYIFGKYPRLAAETKNKRLLEGWAKEDARYILSLATLGQVGMTINARNLEYLFRKFALSELPEIHRLRDALYRQVMKIAPSIILFADPSRFEREEKQKIPAATGPFGDFSPQNVNFEVLDHTVAGDRKILNALLFERGYIDPGRGAEALRKTTPAGKKKFFTDFFSSWEFFDRPPRAFELADITFRALVSSSAFAQIKRHRMATLISGPYGTDHGNTIPPSLEKTGLKPEFADLIRKTNRCHRKLAGILGPRADYILTNSHRRPIQMKMNLREIYHFSRLREDEHAQWDIRDLARRVSRAARRYFPHASMLLGGKSDFRQRFMEIYGKPPEYNI